MYKSIFSKNNTDDSRTVVESKGVTYLPLDFSSDLSEEVETQKSYNPLDLLFGNLDSFSNSSIQGVTFSGYNPRYSDLDFHSTLDTDTDTSTDTNETFTKESFKAKMLPLYERALEMRGLDKSFARSLVAQDGLETRWGNATIGQFNYGNITGKSGVTRNVREYINNEWTTKNQNFVNFASEWDYVNAKIDLLNNSKYDVFSHPVSEFAQRVKNGGYATAPNYAEVLNNTIRTLRKGGILQFDGGGVQLPTPSEIKNKLQPYNTWTIVDNWHPPMSPSYVNSKPDAEGSVLGFNNAKEVYEYILSLPGSNPAIAAGWTGVFMKESGLDHNAVNKSSGANGIAQLLGARRTEYEKWLKGRPDNWQNQISWVWEKVNNGVDDWQVYYDALKDKVDRGIKLSEEESKHWNSMKNSKYRNYSFQNYRDKINNMYDPGDIVELMTWTFERPGSKEAHIDQRREYANAVYNQFN